MIPEPNEELECNLGGMNPVLPRVKNWNTRTDSPACEALLALRPCGPSSNNPVPGGTSFPSPEAVGTETTCHDAVEGEYGLDQKSLVVRKAERVARYNDFPPEILRPLRLQG